VDVWVGVIMEDIDEVALLKAYNLDSLEPTVWSDVDHASGNDVQNQLTSDEPDPLGLRGVLSIARLVDKEALPLVHPSSKTFEPKVFLSSVHPDATFADLNTGSAYLKQSIGQRSGALKILVESNFDKFVAVKATTDGVFREMSEQKEGPLREENDHGVRQLKEVLGNASAKADQVFMPVLENNLKAMKLRSTLGVFERSRFFFNLPGSLDEAIQAGRYEQAVRDYKRGKYLMDSRPGQLLAFGSLSAMPTAANIKGQQDAATAERGSNVKQVAAQQRVFGKVWEAVEATMKDMREILLRQLQESRRSVEEQEKTIEILLDLDVDRDPVAVFLQSQHDHIRNLMRKSFEMGINKVEGAASVDRLVARNETDRAKDLQSCIRQSGHADATFDRAIGVPFWKAILDLVRLVSETMVQTIPGFWKVLADDRLKGRSVGIQAQAKAWASENVEAYIATLVQFFHLTDVSLLIRQPLSPLPSWVPANTSSLTAGHYLRLILNELAEAINDLKALKIGSTADTLQSLLTNVSFCFTEVLCQLWQEDAKIFHRLEDWTMNPEEEATTLFLGEVAAFHSTNARLSYVIARICRDSNERQITEGKKTSTENAAIPADFTTRVKATFVDAIYVYLDGLVHLAFSEFQPLDASHKSSQKLVYSASQQTSVVDVKQLDTRILLGVTNLSHFTRVIVPNMSKHFHEAFSVRMGDDLRTIDEVAVELDKILFTNYIERKGKVVSDVFKRGILDSGIDWQSDEKPTEVHHFIYEALLALVQIHAQVRSIAKPLVNRTITILLENIADVILEAFSAITKFGMGGMLQATLEIEFVHQTLALYVSPRAEGRLKRIYETISEKYDRKLHGDDGNAMLQAELENVKRILVKSRKATALEFLCFRKPREMTPATEQDRKMAMVSGSSTLRRTGGAAT
jgi:exocyst complex component 2